MAQWQARRVVALLEENHPHIHCEIVVVSTRGDRDRKTPLHMTGGVGVFVKELELALLSREIDLAVHSLKDMPSQVPPGLALSAVPRRGDPRDALVSKSGAHLADLPAHGRVGTGSPRRKAELLALRPDLVIVGIRGNVETRLRKLQDKHYDAVVLAAAGLVRLGRDSVITQVLPPETMLPAAGQGALGVETRADDARIRALVAPVNHRASWAAVMAERAFMARLGAGCHVPAAAYAIVDRGDVWLRGLVASHDGKAVIRGHEKGPTDDPVALGTEVADSLLRQGAGAFVQESETSLETSSRT